MYATDQSSALCSLVDPDLSSLAPCSHQEADTRLFMSVRTGCKKTCVLTVDTDVVVIAIAMFRTINPDEL